MLSEGKAKPGRVKGQGSIRLNKNGARQKAPDYLTGPPRRLPLHGLHGASSTARPLKAHRNG